MNGRNVGNFAVLNPGVSFGPRHGYDGQSGTGGGGTDPWSIHRHHRQWPARGQSACHSRRRSCHGSSRQHRAFFSIARSHGGSARHHGQLFR
jgi:hypothetical protein